MSYLTTSPFVADLALLPPDDPQEGLRRTVRHALIALGVLLFGIVGGAALVRVTGAVVGFGEVSVASQVKKVAHPTGGVIAQVLVRDGDRVRRGQPLLRLDTTVSGVTATTSDVGLAQLFAMRARLSAERDGLSSVTYPAALAAAPTPAARDAMAEETRLFRLHREARLGQQAQIVERVRQMQEQIGALNAQLYASRKQSELIEPERAGTRVLWEKKLITINRVNQLERTAVELEGGTASLRAQIAQARARIAEIRQSSIQLDQDARAAAGAQLNEVLAKLNDQQVRTATAGDAYERSIVRAPADGIVDKLAFTTVGGIVPAAQTIVEIVPDTDRMTVEAKVSPTDIDRLRIGQEAMLRFSAFSAQTTPELKGRLAHVAPERTVDERSGSAFYKVRVEVSDAELKRLGGLKLVPGMPVEAFIRSGDRSLLSYVVKPIHDQLSRSFREE